MRNLLFPTRFLEHSTTLEGDDNLTNIVKNRLLEALSQENLQLSLCNMVVGPHEYQLDFTLGSGLRLAKLNSKLNSIAMHMGISEISITPVVGKPSTICFHIPRENPSNIDFYSLVESESFSEAPFPDTFILGYEASGQPKIDTFENTGSLFIAGTTGTGKTTCLKTLVSSILFKASPNELRLVLVDTNNLVFNSFDGLPHMLLPVSRNIWEGISALRFVYVEMRNRLAHKSRSGSGNNSSFISNTPRIVVIIDDMNDIIQYSVDDLFTPLRELLRFGPSVGIHLIVSAQYEESPLIKRGILPYVSSRATFALAPKDRGPSSKRILGVKNLGSCAEMLFLGKGNINPQLVYTCEISENDIRTFVETNIIYYS